MPLEKTCEARLNTLVFVMPVIGYGWSRIPKSNSIEQQTGIDPPAPFGLKIEKLHFHKSEIRAVTGAIECEGHPLHGLWASLVVRDGGGVDWHNFTDKTAKHNVHIGKSMPIIEISDAEVPMVEWVQFEGVETLLGMAYVAESRELLQELYKWLK